MYAMRMIICLFQLKNQQVKPTQEYIIISEKHARKEKKEKNKKNNLCIGMNTGQNDFLLNEGWGNFNTSSSLAILRTADFNFQNSSLGNSGN